MLQGSLEMQFLFLPVICPAKHWGSVTKKEEEKGYWEISTTLFSTLAKAIVLKFKFNHDNHLLRALCD